MTCEITTKTNELENEDPRLRWFPSFALRIPTTHDICALARANERARVQNIIDFPQTKLDSEVNARFLVNEHSDPHFLFYKFNENNILNNWEKNWPKSLATFLANEVNSTERDVDIKNVIKKGGHRACSHATMLTNTVIKVAFADLRAQQISAIIFQWGVLYHIEFNFLW